MKPEEEVMNEILTGQPAHQEEGDESEERHVEESQMNLPKRQDTKKIDRTFLVLERL